MTAQLALGKRPVTTVCSRPTAAARNVGQPRCPFARAAWGGSRPGTDHCSRRANSPRLGAPDISLIDAAQLRRQAGVVLQENVLFNRSVRENIAIADSAAPLQAVLRVAQLAGAHEFISELPQGYDTMVGEQGTGLSGGQRQRIAIARALFTNPRILIFDEATSALDCESEAILQHDMVAICQGRTVIVIAHRLSAVRQAHRIVVMERGRIVEAGSHEELLQQRGLYAHLWSLQRGVAPTTPVASGPTKQESRP